MHPKPVEYATMNRTFALSLAVAAACAALGAQIALGRDRRRRQGAAAPRASDPTSRPAASRMSTSIRRTPTSGTWPARRAVCSRPRTAATRSRRSSTRARSFSLGAVKVDPKDSNVVWLGTGENNNQRSVAFGDGIYKSIDAGKTWKRMGLENSEHIQNIVIDPRNSKRRLRDRDRTAVAGGGDRGLYKTTDGGATWKNVLTGHREQRRDRHRDGSEEARHDLRRDAAAAAPGRPARSAADRTAASSRAPTAARSSRS